MRQMLARERAIRGYISVARAGDVASGGLAHLHRRLEGFLHDAERSSVSGTTFDDIDPGAGNEPHHLGRFRPHVLRPRMAGEMRGDAALNRRKAGREALLSGDVHDIFVDIESSG